MVDVALLKETIDATGRTIPRVAELAGISDRVLYYKLEGKGQFNALEIQGLTKALGLNKTEREKIFFA